MLVPNDLKQRTSLGAAKYTVEEGSRPLVEDLLMDAAAAPEWRGVLDFAFRGASKYRPARALSRQQPCIHCAEHGGGVP